MCGNSSQNPPYKAKGYKYGTEYELATLGVLALLSENQNEIIEDIIETDDFLSEQKGYGFFGVGKKQRIIYAGMLVTIDYTGQSDAMHSAAIGGTISVIAASSAAASSASSGGN